MRDEHKYTQDQLAKLLGKSRNTISEILSINNLPEEIRNDCREDSKCSKSKLIEIAKEKTPKKMEKLYERIKNLNMTTLELKEKRKKVLCVILKMMFLRSCYLLHLKECVEICIFI